MLYIVSQMNAENFVQLGVRVPMEIKQALNEEARRRHLDAADVVREALREYVARHPLNRPCEALAEKAEVAA